MDSQLLGLWSRGQWGGSCLKKGGEWLWVGTQECAVVSRTGVNITYCVAVTGQIIELFIPTLSGPRLGPFLFPKSAFIYSLSFLRLLVITTHYSSALPSSCHKEIFFWKNHILKLVRITCEMF